MPAKQGKDRKDCVADPRESVGERKERVRRRLAEMQGRLKDASISNDEKIDLLTEMFHLVAEINTFPRESEAGVRAAMRGMLAQWKPSLAYFYVLTADDAEQLQRTRSGGRKQGVEDRKKIGEASGGLRFGSLKEAKGAVRGLGKTKGMPLTRVEWVLELKGETPRTVYTVLFESHRPLEPDIILQVFAPQHARPNLRAFHFFDKEASEAMDEAAEEVD